MLHLKEGLSQDPCVAQILRMDCIAQQGLCGFIGGEIRNLLRVGKNGEKRQLPSSSEISIRGDRVMACQS